MSRAYINPFTHVDYGRYGGGAQCFSGVCAGQGRADVIAAGAWPASPHLTVGPDTSYVAVFLQAPDLVYAGPSASATGYEAGAAAYPAGWWPMSVGAGDVVVIRDVAN